MNELVKTGEELIYSDPNGNYVVVRLATGKGVMRVRSGTNVSEQEIGEEQIKSFKAMGGQASAPNAASMVKNAAIGATASVVAGAVSGVVGGALSKIFKKR